MAMYTSIGECIGNMFSQYGMFIAKNPVSAIGFAILLNGLLGVNILRMSSDSDLEEIYTPTDSQASRDRVRMKALFPDTSSGQFYPQHMNDLGHYGSVVFVSHVNILDESNIMVFKNVSDFIKGITIQSEDDELFSYENLCAKRNNQCVIDGEFVFSHYFWTSLQNDNVTFPLYENECGTVENVEMSLGAPLVVDGILDSALAVKLNFNLRQDSDKFIELARLWERNFVKEMKKLSKIDGIDVTYAHSDSLNQEVDTNADKDIPLFSLTFTLMSSYASFVTAGGNCLTQRGHLGRAGVISAALAILGAFGFCAAIGVQFVHIVGVMPYLIVGKFFFLIA